MSKKKYTVYYNAVATDQGSHLLAVGWTNCAGCKVRLTPDGETSDFMFEVKEPDGPSAQVLTPFECAVKIPGQPRSIHVTDDTGKYHVQVNGIDPCSSSANTAGAWVES